VAQGKPTKASTSWPDVNPSNANDGNFQDNNHPKEWVNANGDADPMWEVDLERALDIRKVVYYNRGDCC